MTIDELCALIGGVQADELHHWIANDWLHPGAADGAGIDIARGRLIAELRHGLGVDEEAMPLVLSLLDQLYETRRRLRSLHHTVMEVVPAEYHATIVTRLRMG
jgi:chaperone modulatory protein CbpM